MKYSVAPLSYIFVVVSFTLSFAGDAVTIGALTGGVMGKGIFADSMRPMRLLCCLGEQ